MSQRLYDSATAEALMKFAYPEYLEQDPKPYEIRETGVFATEAFRNVCPPGTVFDWTPADEMGWPGSPNPDTAPFLPIPFDATQLAAAMIDGPGQSIAHAMKHRLGFPLSDDAVSRFSDRMMWMRDAIAEAYEVAAAAQSVVGEFDHEQEERAHAMAQQYEDANEQANEREGVFQQGITQNEARARRARAVAAVADLKARVEEEQAEIADKWKAWRKAMVRQLLWADSRRSYVARRLEETQSEENKMLTLVANAAFERLEKAQLKLERREAILKSPETLCVPVAVAEADVEKAKRERAEAETAIRVMRGDFSDTKTEQDRLAESFGFYSVFLDLEHWAALADVSAREAAMLLSLHNPRKESFEEAKTTIRPDMPEWHLEHLDRRLADYALQNARPCRALLDWYSAAQEMQIKLDPGAVSFMEHVATRVEFDASQGAAQAHSKLVPPSNGPLPLTTSDIAFCFDGIRWNEQKWRKPLGDKPKWLKSCVAIPGQRGSSETRWNPVLIAAALVHDGHAQARSIRARFQTKPQLKDWLEAWKTYEADNFDTQ